ncbi:hypothetical protein AB3S75_037305 [Citrus x aurantiifolia]
MSPSDLLLAKQACSQLLQQGLIEPTDSDWTCQAFYVEKRSELVRGKKRLVIDYQPLNSFLKDRIPAEEWPYRPNKKKLDLRIVTERSTEYKFYDPTNKSIFESKNAHYFEDVEFEGGRYN